MAPRLLTVLVCGLVFSSRGSAALDPEADKPYHLQVVLLFAEHRTFTPVFQEQVERELRDHLQTALGNLAKVTALREHPLGEEIRTKGLRQVLDSVRLVSNTKTHFVLLDFANGQYQIQARQHDGSTGMRSGDVRQAQIGDRQLVARTVALLIDKDFGIIGTLPAMVGNPQQGQKLTLSLKGGRLGVPLDRWVKKDEVFQIVQMSQGAATPQAALVPGAVLQVLEEPRDGACVCQLWYRYSPALPGGPAVLGFRALKLGTTESRLRLQIVRGDKGRDPLHALTVSLSSSPAAPGTGDAHATNLNEPLHSRQKYSHLAFVTIHKQGAWLAGPFPVPVIGEAPVAVPVGATEEADRRGPLQTRLRALDRGVSDSVLVRANLTREYNKSSEKAPETAIQNGRMGLRLFRNELQNQEHEVSALRAEAGKLGVNLQRELGELERSLKDLRAWSNTFEKHLGDLETVRTNLKDPKLKEWQEALKRAAARESALDYDEALALYEEVLSKAANVPKDLRDRIVELKRKWEPRSEEHRAARHFIYRVWPGLTGAARIKEQLPEAARAFRICREAGDQLTPQKLLEASLELSARLRKENDGLRPETNDDDRKTAETIEEVAAALATLIEDVSNFVKKADTP